ncbi:MAG: hypothetical protein GVY04_19445 [Cyanobacteria bacterium]|jgi:predicted nuclease of predicted toxin-antitoxin system|nr:hypothetical protein [Cyanobacteria bacterium GSL.Bin1]
MRFLADMGVSQTVVHWLQQAGHEALHLREEGLQRLADSSILEKAKEEKRIILTFDLDFSDLLAASSDSLPSVIIFRIDDATPNSVINKLRTVLGECGSSLEQGAIIIVENSRYRVRKLPI